MIGGPTQTRTRRRAGRTGGGPQGLLRWALAVGLLLLGLVSVADAASWYNTNWPYRKKLTIDYTKVGATLSHFPVLVSLSSDSDLAASARSDGYDILFTSSDGTTKLDHEIEKYTSATGALMAWVRIPSLSSSADTDIYLYYGYASASDQQNKTGVWAENGSNNYKGVWHLKEDPSGTAPQMKDSTTYADNGTTYGSMTSGQQVTGEIDGSLNFDGSNDYVDCGDISSTDNLTQLTISAWVKPTSDNNNRQIVSKYDQSGGGKQYLFRIEGNTPTTPLLLAISNDGGTDNTLTSTSNISYGAWSYVVGVYDGSYLRIYINGAAAGSVAYSSGIKATSTESLLIGYRKSDEKPFYGGIDEVRLAGTARASGWITTEYNNQSNPGPGSGAFFKTLGSQECQAETFAYRKSITVGGSQVSGGPLSNFPMLVNISSDANLKSVANGGNVWSNSGYDIIFRALDDTTCGGAGTSPCTLAHEIETYAPTTGQLVAWVKVPSINNSTVIYLYYGNCCITSSTQQATDVWDSSYEGVWHLQQSGNGTSGEFKDSTSKGRHGTAEKGGTGSYPHQESAKIGYGQHAPASDTNNGGNIDLGTWSIGTGTAYTIEAWVNFDSIFSGITQSIFSKDGSWTFNYAIYKGDWGGAGRAFARVNAGGTDYYTNPNTSYSLSASTWYYIVGIYNGSTLKVYQPVSGVMTEVGTVNCSGALLSNTYSAKIARIGTTGNSYLNGYMDEVRISSTARSTGWMTTSYNNQNAPSSFYSLGSQVGAGVPSAVRLRRATATALPEGGVLLQWETGWEQGNLGFHLWRVEGAERVRVTPELLAGSALRARGRHTHLTAGHAYAWRDPAGGLGGSYYLEDVDVNGTRTLHGPLAVGEASGRAAPALARSPVVLRELSQLRAPRPLRRHAHRPAAATGSPLAVQARLLGRPAVKVLVESEGWVQVSQPDLLAAGLDPAVDPRTLQLFAEGVEVPLALTGNSATRFGPEATLGFYGTGLDTPWTDTRTYWLTWGQARGQRLPVSAAMGAGGPAAPSSFLSTVTRADRVIYVATLLNGEASNFFGPVVGPEPAKLLLPVPAPDPAGAAAALTVTLQGVTAGAHQVTVAWNGAFLGTLSWQDDTRGTLTLPLPPHALAPGENLVTLTATGGEEDVSLVDSVSLTYPRRYVAEGDVLRCSVPGGSQLAIAGFTTPAAWALDLTDPAAPSLLTGRVRSAGDGTYTLTLKVPGAGPRTLYALSGAAVQAPAGLLPHTPHALPTGMDLLLLAPAPFHEGLAPLVELRQRQGLRVALLDPQALYDRYSFGAKDPAAIKSFLAALRAPGGRPPRFLLLAGAASVDPRDYLGTGSPDWLPTPTVDTALLETADDDWYADFDGTGVPALAVGRLPVKTLPELATVVEKLLAYEAAPPTAPWAHRALFLADTAPDFEYAGASAALAAALPAPFGAAPLLTARADFLAAWGQGAGLVSYLGHGSVGLWSGAGLLASEDADTLGNGDRLPIVLAFTCFTGFHHDPYTESLAAALLAAEGGGAVAVWGSSGMTEPTAQLPLAQGLLPRLRPGAYLGELLRQAKSGAADPDVRHTWSLFGDPSMPIK